MTKNNESLLIHANKVRKKFFKTTNQSWNVDDEAIEMICKDDW